MAERLLPALPIHIEEHIIGFLHPSEVACGVRLVNKAAAARYRGPGRTTVRLSQPVPHHAYAQRCEASGGVWIKALSLRRRLELLCLTAASGDLTNLELAVRVAGLVLRGEVMETASAAGHIHVCLWLRQQGCPWGYALKIAAGKGRREMCEWLLASGFPVLSTDVCSAARGGHLGLAEWLRRQLPPGAMSAGNLGLVVAVAHGGELPALQRLFLAWRDAWQQQQQQQQAQGPDDDEQQQQQRVERTKHVLAFACGSPTPDACDKVEWLEAQGCPRSGSAGAVASRLPAEAAVDRLRWLRQRGYPLAEQAVDEAAGGGHVAALQYLLGEAGVEVGTSDPARQAASRGHLAALQLLHAHGCPVDPVGGLPPAAWNGHLHVVSWVVGTFGLTAADLQEHAVRPAVRSGNMELVDWLVGRGCNFSREDDILTAAAEGGCEVMLERLVQLGCPWPGDGTPYCKAARQGDLATLRCLNRLGCPWGPGASTFTGIVQEGARLPVLCCLVEVGCPVDWAEARETASGMEVVDRLAEGVRAWLEDGLRRSRGAGDG